jgi:hypothetical protein
MTDKKVIFGTVEIQVPEKMHTRKRPPRQKNIGLRNTLTKANNFSKANTKQSINVAVDDSLSRVVIDNTNKRQMKVLKGYIINKDHQKILWNTITIRVPETMYTETKKHNVGERKTITKSKNLSKSDKKQSIKITTDPNIQRARFISRGLHKTRRELKEYIIEKYEDFPDDDVELPPDPPNVPQHLVPLLESIETRVQSLVEKGNQDHIVYKADSVISHLASIVIAKKFDDACIIRGTVSKNTVQGIRSDGLRVGIKMWIRLDGTEDERIRKRQSDILEPTVAGAIIKQINKCIEKKKMVIIIPLEIRNKEEIRNIAEGVVIQEAGHMNLLVLRVGTATATLERFEPHGSVTQTDMGSFTLNQIEVNNIVNTRLSAFTARLSTGLGRTVTYSSPEKICPQYGSGPQGSKYSFDNAESENEKGYCQLHSMLLMELIHMNPNMSTSAIMTGILDATGRDKTNIRKLMRGYAKEMDILIKEISPNFSMGILGQDVESIRTGLFQEYINAQNS